MTQDEHVGLRDRKRRETRARLEDAAVTLVLRDGLEHTTVDAISEMADVSPRTFFNYFESKDAAILGVHQIDFTDDMVAAHLAKHSDLDPVESLVHLFLNLLGVPLSRSTIQRDRMEIVRRYPQLLTGQFSQVTQMAENAKKAVREVLAGYPQFAGDSSDDSAGHAARAEIMFALCSTGMRLAMEEWAAATAAAGTDTGTDTGTGTDTDTRAVTDVDAARENIEQRAITLVREVIERLK
ncbi:TetR/AcrR family transcriptional regulator [Leifsonia kafniensis]|uniref:TetR/AcrR family transcriptional regulator n=1 Tax=Leifsonia kafniensis TaxID=475957 RepID=A0ABP7KTX2_9MICO